MVSHIWQRTRQIWGTLVRGPVYSARLKITKLISTLVRNARTEVQASHPLRCQCKAIVTAEKIRLRSRSGQQPKATTSTAITHTTKRVATGRRMVPAPAVGSET